MRLLTENDILEVLKELKVSDHANITFVCVDGKIEPITLGFNEDGDYLLEFLDCCIVGISRMLSDTYKAGIIALSVNYILQKIDAHNNEKEKEDKQNG